MNGIFSSPRYRKLGILGLLSFIALTLYGIFHQPDRRALYRQYYQSYWGSSKKQDNVDGAKIPGSILSDAQLDPMMYVNGPPGPTFRGNLRSDLKYITSWSYGGSTNNLMAMTHVILLGLLTRRIPIIPPLTSERKHMGGELIAVPFGQIFDLPRISKELQLPILEWEHVKNYTDVNAEVEELGCWTAVAPFTKENRHSVAPTPPLLKLADVYTSVPPWCRLKDNGPFSTFQGLSTILFPPGRREALADKDAATKHTNIAYLKDSTRDPDEHLACFDTLYYVSTKENFEWEWPKRFSPAWNLVATNIFFTERVERLAEEELRGLLLGGRPGSIPPYIALHVRRTDFAGYCNKKYPLRECFAQVSDFAKAVEEIKADLKKDHGASDPLANVEHVIMTSDERDPEFWEEVTAAGWKYVNYTSPPSTEFAKMYPTLIDMVIQSNAVGLVGTDGSTMSLVSARRVYDWKGGPHRFLKNNYHWE